MLTRRFTTRISFCSRQCVYRQYSTTSQDSSAPPLLLKLRSEMKVAMKAKDTNRLNVLRAILAETTNASKTSAPIKTDIQLLSLLRKRIAASRSAAQEFSDAKRDDLCDKELSQVAVIEEYAAAVETVGQDIIAEVVARVIGAMRTNGQALNMGIVLKALVGPGGELDGKPVDKAEVARIVKGML